MKLIATFALSSFIFTTSAFAMLCPTGAITDKGDSLDNVLRHCGKPDAQKKYVRIVPSTERLIYYRADFNQGFNTEIDFTTSNDSVSDIALLGTQPGQVCYAPANPGKNSLMVPIQCGQSVIHPTSTTVCGYPISIGDSLTLVLQACGEPATRQQLQSNTIHVDELTYGNLSPNVWVFNDGTLVDFTTN